MKNILKLIFLFSIIFIKSQSDENSELEIKYDFVFVNDTLDKSHPLSEQMTLLTNGKKSNYFSENYKARAAAFGRQLRGATNNEVVTINMSGVPEAKVKHSVYKDENGIFISNSLGRTLYTFKSADLKTWKIFNQDTKNILGYKCTKATIEIDNKKYIAWFTYDIPIND
ncbi:GLPGLI family protein [Chryseobacterium wanjuense]